MRSFVRSLSAAGASALIATTAAAGGAGSGLTVIYAADPTLDRVFRLQDFDQDGDFDGAGETVVYYDGASGPFALVEPVAIATDPNDRVFVGDSATDRILVLSDDDENGTATGPGEALVYFDGTPGGNASGVLMPGVTSLALRILGTLWVANVNPDGSSTVIRLRDLNADGDANDAGEAVVYCVSTPTSLPSVLTSIDIGFDGLPYVLEDGGAYAKGLYRLIDLDGSGAIDAPSERQAYWLPTQAVPGELISAEVGADGEWYVLDRANGLIHMAFDVNRNGGIDVATEEAPFWAVGANGAYHDMAVAVDGGAVYLGDQAASPSRIRYAEDTDASGAIDPGTEVFAVYDETFAPVTIADPHGLATDFHDHEEVGDAFCTGDSPLCPCNNLGDASTGCATSLGVGATLEGTGTDGIANDDLVLEATQLPPSAPALLFVGTAAVNGGTGAAFGDGLRCAGGAVVRLGVQFADAIGFAEWGPGYAAQQGWLPGDTRYFQVWFRNLAGPCGSGFNLTNGVQVTFTQ